MGTTYFYLRALEIEGRHPVDAGIWPITARRLVAGEGVAVAPSPWSMVHFPEGSPFPSTRRPPPEVLRPNRSFYYRRIRSAEEAGRFLWAYTAQSLGVAT